MTPEQKARVSIDALREFPLNTGYGFADYLLYIDGKAAGVIEAKKEGSTLTGIEAHLTSNQFDTTARVTICAIQRLLSMLKLRANIVAMEFQRI